MAATTLPVSQPVAIPVRQILPWAVFAGVLLVLGVYFVGVEQGLAHEFVHDARHLLGFPCH
jgi:cobalt transporter subunit CbtB